MEPDTTVVLDGLVLAGAPLVIDEVGDARPRNLVLRHCTLVPGLTREPDGEPAHGRAASLIVLHPFASVTLDHCVVGPSSRSRASRSSPRLGASTPASEDEIAFCGRAPPGGGGLRTVTTAADRKTGDGLAAGGQLDARGLHRGRQGARRAAGRLQLVPARGARRSPPDAWPAPIWAERRQVGCIRFSFVPARLAHAAAVRCAGSRSRSRAAPHLAALRRPGLRAAAASDPPGDPYRRQTTRARWARRTSFYQPQRETNLRLRLDEYLRFGLEAGFFYAT